ncbi:MAG: PAS domain S-box protein [Thermoanaerobaculia bacterium]|nr:PAS domain S-box protein [Thermoanaerobaculia bacterium]
MPLSIAGVLVASILPSIALRRVGERFVHLPIHSAMEAVGGVVALAVAAVLLARVGARNEPHLKWVAAAMVSMGALDLAHACVPLGPPFFWSRALPTLIGGLLAAAVWVPIGPRLGRWLPWIVLFATIPICAALLGWPSLWPPMISSTGDYAVAAKWINVTGGTGFLAASVFFVRRYMKQRLAEDLILANQFVIFAVAGVLFALASLWNANFWIFHMLRLIAYLVVLRLVVDVYREHESTARADVETRLDHAYELLQLHVENSPLAVIEWDDRLHVLRWSGGAERMFGWKADEVVGKTPGEWRFIVEADAPAVNAVLERLFAGTDTRAMVANRNYRRDGSVISCEWHNSMLRDREGRLRSLLSLVLDVTDRVEAERGLRDAMEAAEAANRAKDEFLAVASHELRTPMTSLLGWIRMLQTGLVPDKDRAHAIEQMRRAAGVQRRLVEDILDISRSATGRMQILKARHDLVPVVRIAVEEATAAGAERRIMIDLAVASPHLEIDGDEGRIRQAIGNLLGNAIKFSKAGDGISVLVDRDGSDALIRVSDKGAGIAPEFFPKLFQRFRQADGSSTRAFGGLGLGLAIVREIVEAHGGSVAAESAGVGEGTAFTVRLPTVS